MNPISPTTEILPASIRDGDRSEPENERLAAELRAVSEELRVARLRIARSEDAARRRLERDLHDGAQQRLVSAALSLRLLAERLDGSGEQAKLLAWARDELDGAVGELRQLARGLYPAVLSERGLAEALGALCDRAPLPVELAGAPAERFAAPIEATAYFVVSEALTNVAKHAGASRATVRVRRAGAELAVEVSDDGRGGAHFALGSGLRGLADRVGLVGGRLDVDSEPGVGTRLAATFPID